MPIQLQYGDESAIVTKCKSISMDEIDMGAFDEVECDLFEVIKGYAEALGLRICHPDGEDGVDFCVVKEIEEAILGTFADAGIKFV